MGDPLHASCSVKWTLSESCATAQQKIIDQMNLWDNEDCGPTDDNKPHGQKCLYHHTGTEGLVTTGTQSTATWTISPSRLSRAAIPPVWLTPTPSPRRCPCWTTGPTTATSS